MATCSVQASVCALCGEPSRYRCPACSIRTCSLACVQLHKSQQSCSGVRETEKFRAVQQFDDAALGRDYRFLEDLDRAVDGSKRALRNEAPPAELASKQQSPDLLRACTFFDVAPMAFYGLTALWSHGPMVPRPYGPMALVGPMGP